MRKQRPHHGAFTLVELLVVMALMAVLFTLAIAFLPNAASSAKESRAAMQVQGWLNVAKQKALRDRRPHGVRFLRSSALIAGNTINNVCVEAQFIEQPEDFTGGLVENPPAVRVTSVNWVPAPPPHTLLVTVTTNVAHYFFLGESVRITGGHWSIPAPPPPLPPPAPPPPPPPPPPTPPLFNETPQEFCTSSHQVTSIPDATTYTFLYSGPMPVPELRPPAPLSNGGIVGTTQRVWFRSPGIGPPPNAAYPSPDLMNGYDPPVNVSAPPERRYWSVQPDDYLEVLGTALVHRITHIDYSPDWPMQIRLTPGVSIVGATPNYRILRAPRVVGEETLKLPEGTVIDLNTNTTYGSPLPQPNATGGGGIGANVYHDVLFSPTGTVISRGMAGANINLWVRAPSEDRAKSTNVFIGDPTIVSIFVRTGVVGAYAPDRSGTNPYALIR